MSHQNETKQVSTLYDQSPAELDRLRCEAFKHFLVRRYGVESSKVVAEEKPQPSSREALVALAGKALLSFSEGEEGAVEVIYTPSRESSSAVASSTEETGFPADLLKKQKAAFRSSEGALFRFPYEEGDGVIEVFITDWSPCPAAGAVAIHRHHPFAADLPKPKGPLFTGKFVRHPLTGDLLPVWVADWVKADFGTGAVLVNPGHDHTDLQFGREVGLPIRFGLVPVEFDGDPATWPEPPIIKIGRTIKTGPYDGLSVLEAMQEYYRVLKDRGLAQRYTDHQAGQIRIARLLPDDSGSLFWDPLHSRLLTTAGDGGGGKAESAPTPMSLADAPLLDTALSIDPGVKLHLLSTATAKTAELLFLRLLYYDLVGEPLRVAELTLVQRVQASKAEGDADILSVACLASSSPNQVVVLKQQVLDQAQRFLRVHGELLEKAGEVALTQEDDQSAKTLTKIKKGILAGDPSRAFQLIYVLQKQLAKGEAASGGAAISGYFALAHLLFGLKYPPTVDLRQVWAAIQIL